MQEITARQLDEKIKRGDKFVLLDVRDRHEYEIAKIPGSRLIPLGEIGQRAHELDKSDEIVLHCKLGGRSAKAITLLQQLGFLKLINLKGGILAWSQEVDPSVPIY